MANPKKWYAVRTKFRCEKQVCRDLISRNFEAYVPIQTLIKKYGRNKRKVDLPLISTYVFVKIHSWQFNEILAVSNIRHFIKFSQTPAQIPNDDILLLKRITGQSEFPFKIKVVDLSKGDKVEIIKGSLAGLCGELIEINGNRSVEIELKSLGISLNIHVPIECIRKTQ